MKELIQYIPTIIQLCYAISGIIGVLGAIITYIAMNNEERVRYSAEPCLGLTRRKASFLEYATKRTFLMLTAVMCFVGHAHLAKRRKTTLLTANSQKH